MAKDKIAYVCSNCGQESAKWLGKCPSCGQWNTFKEIRVSSDTGSVAAASAASTVRGGRQQKARPLRLRDIPTQEEPRIDMHDSELNRVLGGGLVPGSIILLGGEPGIGKSTLTLQTILHMTDRHILYVSGEESAHQLKMRAQRIGHDDSEHVMILCETSLEQIFTHIKEEQPELVVIDSIQTISTEDVDSSPGSVTQVRECASALLRFAKSSGVPVILIGHINKEGTLAGPKILEHIVDTVIQFEGDQHYMYRILRAMKNRFGSTSELGIYEMQQNGLRQVSNPSELLRIVDSGLRNHAYKFIRIEAFLSAISDWVRGLGISRSGARGVTFFRLNPNKNSMKLNGRYLHMPEGLGLCEAMEPYPFDGISYEDTAAVQVNRNKSGKYKIKVVKVKPAPFRGGRAITGDHAEYWESLMILRQILRDHRMGIDVESRLSDWLAYRSEILYNTDK